MLLFLWFVYLFFSFFSFFLSLSLSSSSLSFCLLLFPFTWTSIMRWMDAWDRWRTGENNERGPPYLSWIVFWVWVLCQIINAREYPVPISGACLQRRRREWFFYPRERGVATKNNGWGREQCVDGGIDRDMSLGWFDWGFLGWLVGCIQMHAIQGCALL